MRVFTAVLRGRSLRSPPQDLRYERDRAAFDEFGSATAAQSRRSDAIRGHRLTNFRGFTRNSARSPGRQHFMLRNSGLKITERAATVRTPDQWTFYCMVFPKPALGQDARGATGSLVAIPRTATCAQ
jgi:hypothetical protein